MRIGIGYDVHPMVSGQKLVLGGVEISFNKGLYGHSDADVLTHAIIDALLGAAGLKDIGTQFPSGDQKYKDISSLVLLDKVDRLLKSKGYSINNIDATIIAQQPKLSQYIDDMRNRLSQTLHISAEQVMVKATTTEGLGFVGKEQGIATLAIASIEKGDLAK